MSKNDKIPDLGNIFKNITIKKIPAKNAKEGFEIPPLTKEQLEWLSQNTNALLRGKPPISENNKELIFNNTETVLIVGGVDLTDVYHGRNEGPLTPAQKAALTRWDDYNRKKSGPGKKPGL